MSSQNQPDQLDVYREVILDHNNIKDLYLRYRAAATNDSKKTIVNTLIREIVQHGEAEEVTVYNDLEKQGQEADAKRSRHEHQELEEALYAVDKSKIDDPDFDQKLKRAIRIFVHHGEEEEQQVLPALRDKLTPQENDGIARKFIQARNIVPTHPHPDAPQHGKALHKFAGVATRPLDKFFDLARSFTDVKFKHPAKPGDPAGEPMKFDPKLLE
jgi:hemerythrin superfamily protein